jgi:hypothetical protein
MPNRPAKRKHICHVCGRLRTVNDLGRIAAHDMPGRRGHRCSGGGFKVAKGRMPTANMPRYIKPR